MQVFQKLCIRKACVEIFGSKSEICKAPILNLFWDICPALSFWHAYIRQYSNSWQNSVITYKSDIYFFISTVKWSIPLHTRRSIPSQSTHPLIGLGVLNHSRVILINWDKLRQAIQDHLRPNSTKYHPVCYPRCFIHLRWRFCLFNIWHLLHILCYER